jgi:arsenite-transporting ATPase
MVVEPMSFEGMGKENEAVYKNVMSELTLSVPGIDEAASFSEMLSEVKNYNFSSVVFDTAPTGHTLKLLSFPGAMEKGLEKLLALKEKFGGMLSTVASFVDPAASGEFFEKIFSGIERTKDSLEKVLVQFKNTVTRYTQHRT